MQIIKVGVIGVGFMGTNHVKSYASMPDADLVGVADVDFDRAKSVAEQYGTTAYRSADELLEKSDAEAVSICTSDEQHVEPTINSLHAGKHVLLEKPLATTLEDADRILNAAAGVSHHFLVGHLLRFEDRYVEAKKAVEEGRIGDVVSLFARRINPASAQQVLKGRVSVLSFLGVHDFDLCGWYAGSPAERVFCEERRGFLSSRGFNVEDQTFTLIHFENGVIACVEAGWVFPDSHPRGCDFRMEIVGTKGVINLELMSHGIAVCDETGYHFPTFGHGIELELAHFFDCIKRNATPGISGVEARQALEISLAAQSSAKSGTPVSVGRT